MLKPWWERIPERLDYEIEALRTACIEYARRNADYFRGILILDLVVRLDNEVFQLRAEYPDLYPYVRPEVYADHLTLRRHQNPFGKNLCLLGRRSDIWQPEMTLAQLITEQLPNVLAANRETDPARLSGLEEHQGEPLTAFYDYIPGIAALIESEMAPRGFEKAATATFASLPGNDKVIGILDLYSASGKTAATMSSPTRSGFTGTKRGRWVVLASPIQAVDGKSFNDELVRRHPELRRREYAGDRDYILVGFPDELQWLREDRNWVMLVRIKQSSKASFKNDASRIIAGRKQADRAPWLGLLGGTHGIRPRSVRT
jgi:hypothetical protein